MLLVSKFKQCKSSVNLLAESDLEPNELVTKSTKITLPLKSFEAPAKLGSPNEKIKKRARSHSLDIVESEISYEGNFIQFDCALPAVLKDTNFIEQIERADVGLKQGVKPILADNSMGGAYFLCDKFGSPVLVCKPGDEEPNSPNNPRKYPAKSRKIWESYKGGITPGFGMYREIATYLLDAGFAGVPSTAFAKISNACLMRDSHDDDPIDDFFKSCSLQSFVEHISSAEDFGPSLFSVKDVQRIAAMDIRLCNLDRHVGNLLVAKSDDDRADCGSDSGKENLEDKSNLVSGNGSAMKDRKFKLIPIDHGFCLPHINFISELQLEWLSWPQSKLPIDQELRSYIENIDIEHDILEIRRIVGEALPESSIITLRLCTALLQQGIQAGLTLWDLGNTMVPDFDQIDDPATDPVGTSQLQRVARTAILNVLNKGKSDKKRITKLNDGNILLACRLNGVKTLIEEINAEVSLLVKSLKQ